jgi:hypothetical protein
LTAEGGDALMPGKVTITVSGTREIEKALKELGVSAANRIARSALNRSATPIVKRAKELVPGGYRGAEAEHHEAVTQA